MMMKTLTENKPAKIFLDTNVIIDALTMRDYDYHPSKQLLRCVVQGYFKGYICSKQITDINYIFRKYFPSKDLIKVNLAKITKIFEILPLLKGDILSCLNKKTPDFEDAVICEVAKVNMIPYIITNNVQHFENCGSVVLTPQQLLDIFSLK